jgi:hypothetical protein
MSDFPPSATAVRFDDVVMWVDIEDGRTLGIPIAWFPRSLHATPRQREDFFISPSGLHGNEIDEDISIGGLLAGHGDMTHPVQSAA